jgi:hypothetical protein
MQGKWVTVTVAKDGTTSSEADLGEEFEAVQVYAPAVDSATITLKPSRKTGETAIQANTLDGNATGHFANTSTAGTAAGMYVFHNICAQFVTLVLSAAQTTAARTFYIRGINFL